MLKPCAHAPQSQWDHIIGVGNGFEALKHPPRRPSRLEQANPVVDIRTELEHWLEVVPQWGDHTGAVLAEVDNLLDAAQVILGDAKTISEDGWDRVEKRARSYGVDATHHRVGAAWPSAPRDDLRQLIDVCERETDDALGILIGSACRALVSHVGFIVGEL